MAVLTAFMSILTLLPPVKRLSTGLKQSSADLAQLHAELTNSEAEVARLRGELEAAAVSAHESATQLDEQRHIQADLLRDLNAATLHYLTAQSEFANQQKEHMEALDRAIALGTELRESKLSREIISAQKDSLFAELKEARHREAALQIHLDTLSTRLNSTLVIIGDLQASVTIANDRARVQEQETQKVEAYWRDQATEFESKIAELTEYFSEQVRKHNVKADEAAVELRGLRDTLVIHQAEFDALQSKADEQACMKQAVEETLATTRQEATAAAMRSETEKHELTAQLAVMQIARDEAIARVASAEAARDEATAVAIQQRAQATDLTDRLATAEARADRAFAEQRHRVDEVRAQAAAKLEAVTSHLYKRVRAIEDAVAELDDPSDRTAFTKSNSRPGE